MTIDEEIEVLKEHVARLDGHSWKKNINNRVFGLLGASLGALISYAANDMPSPADYLGYAVGAGFLLDGLATTATGKFHYLLFRLTRTHPRYKLEELQRERD